VRGELCVRATGKAPIAELFLDPKEARVSEGALRAIREADLIVLGPGGLYCSVLPGILPLPVRDAIRERRGKTAYICNTTTQPGQTDGFDATAHVREVLRYLGDGHLDYALLNIQVPSREVITAYRADDVHFMPVTPEEIRRVKALGAIPIVGKFVTDEWEGKRALAQTRHDPSRPDEGGRGAAWTGGG